MEKIHFWSVLILTTLSFLPPRILAQNSPTDSCQYKLTMQSPYTGGWGGRYLDFSIDPISSGMPDLKRTIEHFSLLHSGSETIYFFMPKSCITVSHNLDYHCTFFLYNENDSLIFTYPGDLPRNFQWYNGCSLDIPDTVTAFSHSVQGNVVTLVWTNPTTTIHGDALNTISSIEIRRNDELLHTFSDAIPGDSLTFSDNMPEDGTYIYKVQCFNEAGGGVPSIAHLITGNNCILHNGSHSGQYELDPTCSMIISNDTAYMLDGTTTLTIHQSDTTKMLRISGHAITDSSTHIQVYAGTSENGLPLPSDTVMMITPYQIATFVFDIPAGSSPEFHYTVECVNSLYEQPDTTITIVPDSNGIIYVTQEGAGLRNGSSWANATSWLNRAMTAADTMIEKPVIWVAAGIYYGVPQMLDNETFAFVGRNGVNVYGGFSGNEPADFDLNLRDFEQNETILDGLLHHTVVHTGEAVWNGFHIQRGTVGCKMVAKSAIRHCLVSECLDAGVYSSNWSVSARDFCDVDTCIITNNGGNGIDAIYSKVRHSQISFNGGNGIQGIVGIHHCVINNNKGKGYYCSGGASSISNIDHCLIANNDGNGIEISWNYVISNSTIVNNENGIVIGDNCNVYNSIIYGNQGVSIAKRWSYISTYGLQHCAVEGDYLQNSNLNIPLASPNDTCGFHPGFVNPTAGPGSDYSGGDWHLLSTSVCVNRGIAYSYDHQDTDLEGNPRIQQGLPDIGAYESSYDHPYEDRKIIYVKENGNGDGSSWANATQNLANAIESSWVYGPNTRIWVARGTYPTPGHPYYLKENLHLMGGFVGDEPADYDIDLRNTIEHASIMDGQQQNRVLHQTYDFDHAALVDGFTITHGQADEGAGAHLMANTTLSKCRVVNNTVTAENAAAVTAVHDTLKQLIVENNDGAGVQTGSSPLLHCTVVRNNGDGIRVSGNTTQDSSLLYNNISWGNALLNLHFTSAMAKQNTPILHCAIENQIMDGEDNIVLSSDNGSEFGPHFINPTDSVGVVSNLGIWLLDSSSVCVNAGAELSDLYGIHTDLASQPRIQSGKVDIGAMESPHSGEVLCRNIEAFIYEGESYMFYGNALTAAGWYEYRWNMGDADSLVVLHLITKQVVYVSETGAGNMDGSSWANALDGQTATADGGTKLAEALQAAAVGTEFWIQSGMYYACSDSNVNKSLVLNEGVSIYGGFAGVETALSQRNTNNAPTVFSGNLQNDTVVEHYSRNIFKTNEQNELSFPIVMNQIMITEGYNTDHTGTALQNNKTSSIHLSHCKFIKHYGTAIFNEGFLNCDYCVMDSNSLFYDIQDYPFIDNNRAGALMNQTTGCISMSHCQITNNNAFEVGAICNFGVMTIDSSSISRNKAVRGSVGAILSDGTLEITNSKISNNRSYHTASSISASGTLKLHHCIVDSNQSCRIGPEYWWPQERWTSEWSAYHISIMGKADVQYCLFKDNNQNGAVGGGCLHIDGFAIVKNCHFVNNIGAATNCFSFVTWGTDTASEGGVGLHVCISNDAPDGGGVHVENGTVYVEDCFFDGQFGKSGTSASVESGKLTMNRCVFSRNRTEYTGGDRGILSIRSGELLVQNSLFANNQNAVFNTVPNAHRSNTTFSNCTFVNNEDKLCVFNNSRYDDGRGYYDTAYVLFNNSIINGNWKQTGVILDNIYPNYIVRFSNTILHHPDSTLSSDCTPDSLGNIYYCDPMFVNPTTVMGNNSAQNPLLYDFRLQDGSPAINSGDTTGLHLAADATDLDGKQRVKRCQIDRGCYEYGTIVYDTVRETLCVEQDALSQLSYNGHGFSTAQLEVGENTFTRTCDCHPDANDSVLTLQLTVSVIQHSEVEAVACDSMVWNGITYTQSGTYTQTLSDRADCDSIVTLHLTINHSVATDDYLTLCENELPYTYGDTVFEVGTPEFSIFHFQFSTTKGCDSLVTLHLTVHEAVETDIHDYLCNGSTYSFFGQELIFPGTYTHVGQTVYGCDSTVNLHLELKQTYSSFLNVNLCNGDGYDFFGETLHDAGIYTQTVPTEFGCDSTIVLTITTGTTTYGDLNASICDGSSYNFYGQQLTESGDYTVTLTNSHGCDSIVTLHLTINSAYHTDQHVSACDTYVWNGQTYSASGDYDKTFTAANGCDSVVTLHLTINPSVATDEYLTISQDELPYTYGDTVFEAGTPEFSIFHFPFSTADGCDSTVTLHLTITVGINDHTGAAMTVYPNPTTGMVNVQCTMNNVQVEAVEFRVYDAFGRLLWIADGVETLRATSLQTDAHDSSAQTQIDLSHYAAGVYYIKAVADGNVIAVRKVIKN